MAFLVRSQEKKSRFGDQPSVTFFFICFRLYHIAREFSPNHRVNENTFYTIERKFDGIESDEVSKIKDLQSENHMFMRIVADQSPLIEVSAKLLRKHALRAPTEDLGIAF